MTQTFKDFAGLEFIPEYSLVCFRLRAIMWAALFLITRLRMLPAPFVPL